MRMPRVLLAGVLLFADVFLLTGLLSLPPYDGVGATALAVFLPLWYFLTAVNAGLGIAAGYRPLEEAVVGLPVFLIPTAVGLVVWWISDSRWDGGPLVVSGRTPVMIAAGLTLWLAIDLLVDLLVPHAGRTAKQRASLAAFLPLWVMVSVANLLLGVFAAGYTLVEELPILVVDLLLPTASAVLLPRLLHYVREHGRADASSVARYGLRGRTPENTTDTSEG